MIYDKVPRCASVIVFIPTPPFSAPAEITVLPDVVAVLIYVEDRALLLASAQSVVGFDDDVILFLV